MDCRSGFNSWFVLDIPQSLKKNLNPLLPDSAIIVHGGEGYMAGKGTGRGRVQEGEG